MTLRHLLSAALAVCTPFVLLAPAARGANYDESVSGDLSDNPSAPTTPTLDPGGNTVTGNAGAGDFDIIHMTIPAGHTLDSLVLNTYHSDLETVSFIGVVAGSTWTAGLDNDVDPTFLLGWTHFGTEPGASVGDDMLIPMSTAPIITQHFTRPLAAGDYTFEIQDTDVKTDYAMTFNLSNPAIPGDFNGDGVVSPADLAKWKGDFGVSGGSDANHDGASDGADFVIWQQQLTASSPTTAVPEPSVLAMVAALFLLKRGHSTFS